MGFGGVVEGGVGSSPGLVVDESPFVAGAGGVFGDSVRRGRYTAEKLRSLSYILEVQDGGGCCADLLAEGGILYERLSVGRYYLF